MPRTLSKSTRARSLTGNASKKAILARSASTSGALSARLIALTSGSRGLMAGQASTQRPQPVQSST